MKCDPTTAAKNLKKNGYDVQARKPMEKPARPDSAVRERYDVCGRWRKLSADHWVNSMHMIMDNKYWEIPTYAHAKRIARKKKVRFVLRTRAEGLKPGFTKPNKKKHKCNPGGGCLVLAGIVKSRVRVWHYLPKGRWGSQKAVDAYNGPIIKCLRRNFPQRSSYQVLEDNDPSGYKSKVAIAAKKELKINVLQFPRYSPDLNPCDFFLWDEISRRMDGCKPRGKEGVEAYKARLRRVALAIPAKVIVAGVKHIKKQAQAIWEAKGHDSACD